MNVLLWNGVEIFNLLYFLIMITTWKLIQTFLNRALTTR